MNHSVFLIRLIKVVGKFQTDSVKDPKKKNFGAEILGQFPNRGKKPKIFKLFVWGELGKDLLKYYKVGDFVIIEGGIFFKRSLKKKKKLMNFRIQKVYPY